MIPVERIGADWRNHTGHLVRYAYAADRTLPGEKVNDIACGIGYGSTFFGAGVEYHGYDRPDVFEFDASFHPCDINRFDWMPDVCDVTVCFETLEHIDNPAMLAAKIQATTRRAVFVSVPTQPTKHGNPFHLHDFTVADIPTLFPTFRIVDVWEQPEELTHVWHLEP